MIIGDVVWKAMGIEFKSVNSLGNAGLLASAQQGWRLDKTHRKSLLFPCLLLWPLASSWSVHKRYNTQNPPDSEQASLSTPDDCSVPASHASRPVIRPWPRVSVGPGSFLVEKNLKLFCYSCYESLLYMSCLPVLWGRTVCSQLHWFNLFSTTQWHPEH